jgi:predicted RNA-binding Zn-ribbon protein involved in translation (DUF1610 family)
MFKNERVEGMREEGVRYTCERCHKQEFIAWEPMRNKYPTDSNWVKIRDDLWLCPNCGREFMEKFMLFLGTESRGPDTF